MLELGTPVPEADAAPLAVGAPDGEAVSIVSYQRGRAQVATLKGPCPPIATVGVVLAVDCAVTWGVSGAPVLAGEGAESRLVAVVSAMGRAFGDRDVALTVLVAPALDGLLAALAEAPLELSPEP